MDERVARLEEQMRSIEVALASIDAKVTNIQTEFHTARGGLLVGKWLAVFLVSIAGIGVTVWNNATK